MSDWSLVGGDPAPGYPDEIRAIATRYRTLADNGENARTELSAVGSQADSLCWTGDAADKFRAELDGDVLENLQKLFDSYSLATTTLQNYAAELDRIQEQARVELQKATAA